MSPFMANSNFNFNPHSLIAQPPLTYINPTNEVCIHQLHEICMMLIGYLPPQTHYKKIVNAHNLLEPTIKVDDN